MSSVPIYRSNRASRTIVRSLIARHAVMEDHGDVETFCRQTWPGDSEMIAKTAVAAIASNETSQGVVADFLQQVRERSALGRLGFRRVPFDVRLLKSTSGAQGYWVGEGKPIPLSKPVLAGSTLKALKAAGIIVLTKESLKVASPLTEAALEEDLLSAVAGILDFAFLDPSNGGVANETPGSVTYGAPSIAATGSDGDALRRDLQALFALYEGDLSQAVIVTTPRIALNIALMKEPLSNTDLSPLGGTLVGIPTATSLALGSTTDGDYIALMDRRGITYNLDDLVLEVGDQTSLIMSDTPPDGPAEMVSLWQTNSVAWKAVADAAWENQREGGVVMITGADYDGGLVT